MSDFMSDHSPPLVLPPYFKPSDEAAPAGSIVVYVMTTEGQTNEYVLEKTMTVENLRQTISDREGVAPKQLRLYKDCTKMEFGRLMGGMPPGGPEEVSSYKNITGAYGNAEEKEQRLKKLAKTLEDAGIVDKCILVQASAEEVDQSPPVELPFDFIPSKQAPDGFIVVYIVTPAGKTEECVIEKMATVEKLLQVVAEQEGESTEQLCLFKDITMLESVRLMGSGGIETVSKRKNVTGTSGNAEEEAERIMKLAKTLEEVGVGDKCMLIQVPAVMQDASPPSMFPPDCKWKTKDDDDV